MFDDITGWKIGMAIGIFMMFAAIVVGMVAIWSVGEIVPRLGGTAGLLGGAGFITTLVCSLGEGW